MHRPDDVGQPQPFYEPPTWWTAVAIAVTIVICIAAFIWIFVSLDPLLSDLVAEDVVVTPTPDATETVSP